MKLRNSHPSPSKTPDHSKQYQTFYRKIKDDLLNFREVKNGYHQDFQYLIVSIHFFYEMATLKQTFMPA